MRVAMDALQSTRFSAALSLDLGDSASLAETSIALLEQIELAGSITAAATACKMSYRSAWQTIEQLQNRSHARLVERSCGGSGGGGSTLTDEGRELIALFRAAEAEHARFVAMLGSSLTQFGHYASFMRRWFMQTSVRNQLFGTVASINEGSVNSEVQIDIGGGDVITAVITHESVGEMQLQEGEEVAALIPESSIILCIGDKPPRISARNSFKGRVMRCCEGVVCAEVSVELPGSKIINAMISFESLAELQLWPDSPVWVCFKASDVMLAVQG